MSNTKCEYRMQLYRGVPWTKWSNYCIVHIAAGINGHCFSLDDGATSGCIQTALSTVTAGENARLRGALRKVTSQRLQTTSSFYIYFKKLS